MSNAFISTLGLYEYDETLFDKLVIPNDVDKELLINNLLLETAELEVLYADIETMRFAIGQWSNKELPTWNKLNELFNEEYNPLYNVDAWETLTETHDLEYKHDNVDTHDLSYDDDTTTTNEVSGFNSSEFKNSNRDIVDGTRTDSGTITTDGTDTDKGTIVRENRRYGNIGVTMAQDMAKKEMDMRPQMNMINYIINSYKNRFCLLVY